eukprot:scaffold13558_cov55-Cyclotella_meneghiniana.AAC.4
MLTKNEKAEIENKIDVSTNYNTPGDECEKIESGTIRLFGVGICKAIGRRAVDWTTVSGDIEHSILFDWISIRVKKIPRILAF